MATGFTLEDLEPQPFQCHFNWGLSVYFSTHSSETIIKEWLFLLDKAKQKQNLLEQFTWHMSLAYMYFVEKNLNKYEVHVHKSQELSNDDRGMFHVFQSNFYYMLKGVGYSLKGSIDSYVNSYQTLSARSKSVVWAIRSLCLLSCPPCALKECLKGFERASSFDPENYHWQMYIGLTKRKIASANNKRYSTDKPELVHFKEVVRLGGPKVFLAKSLAELFLDRYKLKGKISDDLTDLFKSVHDLMNQVLSEETHDAGVYITIGDFFSKFPKPFKNLNRAKQCYEKSISLCPDNPFINHKYAKYLIYTKQHSEAVKYLERAIECSEDGHFSASMELLQLQSTLSKYFDIIQEVERLLRRFEEGSKRAQLYCYLADFLRKSNPTKALQLYREAVEMPKKKFIDWGKTVFRCPYQQEPDGSRKRVFFTLYEVQNVYEVIAELEKEVSEA